MNRNIGIKFGAIAGMAVVGHFLLFYFIQKALFFHNAVFWSSTLIYLVFMVLALRQMRSQSEELTFMDYLRTAFVVFVIANIIYYLFYFLLFNYIDPALADIQEQIIRERINSNSQLLAPEISNQLRTDLDKNGAQFTFNDALMGCSLGFIGGFLYSLIMAYIFNRT